MWKSQKQLISWIHESFYFKFVNFLIGKVCFVKVSSFKTHWTLYISNSQILKKLIQDGRVQNRKKIVQSTFIKKIRKIIFRFHQFCFVSTSLNLTSCFLANDYLVRTIIVTCFGWSQKRDIVLYLWVPVKIRLFQDIKFHGIKPAQNLILSDCTFSKKLALQLFWDSKVVRHSFFNLFRSFLSFRVYFRFTS